jgi:hypothetical protein
VLGLRAVPVTGVIGGGIVGCGLLAGLVIADMPLALTVAVAFGLMGTAGAWTRLREYWLSRARGFRLRPLKGRLRGACARPRWTDEDRAWLESVRSALPGKRGRGR